MKKIINCLFIMMLLVVLSACKKDTPTDQELMGENTGVYYEIFVRSFADSDGDGIGDFNGVTSKLDYLQDLGIKGIWLMPIFDSNSYHGYDIKNYLKINDDYGTLNDFINLLNEAENRDIKIILDIAFNHTSNEHEWFLESLDKESSYADYYVWIDQTDERYGKLGSWDQSFWHLNGTREQYYAGYFSNEMPDLNMENPKVRNEIIDIAKYWLSMGVDGFRLDAALHQYGENEYKNVKTLSANSTWWKEFSDGVKEEYPDAYLVGEVWDDAIINAPFYYGLDSTFNFDISDLIINSMYSYNDGYATTIIRAHDEFRGYNNDFIDAPFLSNHDGNNKEPKARIATTLNGNQKMLKLAAEMLLTLPGNPFIYYGEEIGMEGAKAGAPDYDMPLRSPFIWSQDGSKMDTSWYTNTNYNQNVKSVESQMTDVNSLYNVYKTLIQLRNDSLALHEGDMYFYSVGERNFQSFVRYFEEGDREDAVLVVHNVSGNILDLEFNNSDKLKVIYQSNGTDYASNGKIGGQSTIVFQIPANLIDFYVRK
jgi:alpha-amylase